MVHNFQSARFSSMLVRAAISILILTLLLSPASTGRAQFDDDPVGRETPVASNSSVVPPKPERFDRVYDVAGDLNESQYERFHYDIGRLWDDGLPAVIYIRTSSAERAESQAFADELRTSWDIESAPGADDGIVLLVDIRNRFPYAADLTYSYGANTFPTGQMTPEILDLVLEQEAKPRFQVGNVNGGLTYALRRILYYTEYTAPFPEPRTSGQEIVNTLAIPINGLLTLLLTAISMLRGSRSPLHVVAKRHRASAAIILGAVAVAISAVFAVYGQSAPGTAIAFFNLLLFGMILLQAGKPTPVRRVLRPARRTMLYRLPSRRPRSHRRA